MRCTRSAARPGQGGGPRTGRPGCRPRSVRGPRRGGCQCRPSRRGRRRSAPRVCPSPWIDPTDLCRACRTSRTVRTSRSAPSDVAAHQTPMPSPDERQCPASRRRRCHPRRAPGRRCSSRRRSSRTEWQASSLPFPLACYRDATTTSRPATRRHRTRRHPTPLRRLSTCPLWERAAQRRNARRAADERPRRLAINPPTARPKRTKRRHRHTEPPSTAPRSVHSPISAPANLARQCPRPPGR